METNMKLKTLKDIDMMYEGTPQGEAQLKKDLKNEAIKWVKHLETKKVKVYPSRQMGKTHNSIIDGEIGILKHFHNITEEDLK